MDLDLFGAFDGDEKATAVAAAAPEPEDDDTGDKSFISDAAMGKRRRGGASGEAKEARGDEDAAAPGAGKKAKSAEPLAEPRRVKLMQGGESSTTRPDGTVVKSFSVYPAEWPRDEAWEAPEKPAKTYPFKLDPFQEQAINYIERGESVLVSAHTSAGKTVNAEYAIAKALRDGQKVVYTSPIKALSNQKFRDLQEEFGDVGLMTGDITINPSAACLIMTTEILRSMLYRGSEVMREVAWVVYDEVHYMRDKSRGVVWEESIILLPEKVRFVFLSATIPNSREFVAWVAQTKRQPCHVVYTDFRPVPLEHYIFPAGGDGLYLVVDNKSRFREDNFQKTMATLQTSPEEEAMAQKGKKKLPPGGMSMKKGKNGQGQNNSDLYRVVKLVMERGMDPCIVFSFSKRECEAYALQMSKLDFNDDAEKDLVEQIFVNAVDSLAEEDRQLPQVQALLPLLKKGVGIHHGGLLPLLKEVIEILFGEGLIKCLFATETFSIGLNMPARTVIFTSTRKFDGVNFRWITSGEYIQMSGRAGRRGKDDRGIVIQMLDEKMDPAVAKDILYGAADPLDSSYHISYNMLLNMLRVEGADPEFLVRSSFHQFQQREQAPLLEEEAEQCTAKAAGIKVAGEDEVVEYYRVSEQLRRTEMDMRRIIMRPDHCLPFVQIGRLVKISSLEPDGSSLDWGWGIIINYRKLNNPATSRATAAAMQVQFEVDCLVNCAVPVPAAVTGPAANSKKAIEAAAAAAAALPATPAVKGGPSEARVVPFDLLDIEVLSSIKMNMPQSDMREPRPREAMMGNVQEYFRRQRKPPAPLDPVEDMNIKDGSFNKLAERSKELSERLRTRPFHAASDRDDRYARYVEKVELLARAKALRKEARALMGTAMSDSLKHMKRVLRRLGHCDNKDVIQLKGRVACEINTADELVVTELVFKGAFTDLSAEQTVALLSCFVLGGAPSKEEAPQLRAELAGPYKVLQDAAREVAKAAVDSKIELDPEAYVNSFGWGLMELSYAWCAGATFAEAMSLTSEFEGNVIRCIRRLEELLRQLASASFAIGNFELKQKFEDAANKIRRGIVFTSSLYL